MIFGESELWSLLAKQTIQVTVLIVLVAVATRLLRTHRPRFVHALWALVLLKSLTPPIVASPVSLFGWMPPAFEPAVVAAIEVESKAFESRSEESSLRSLSRIGGRESAPIASRQTSKEIQNKTLDDKPWQHFGSDHDPYFLMSTALSPTRWYVRIWLIGVAASFLISFAKLSRFLHRIRRYSVQPQDETIGLLEQTCAEMQLHGRRFRRVRVQIVDCSIGPAVIGFWSPRILLPRVLESECLPSEMRMLLAHELTHIRRRDLSWAVVELLAKCCWWFHPLLRWVCRVFDRMTELSCDEETIARLRCKPAAYARGLLMVLERKHNLRAAPMLPGVRPVELTSNRMERIMKLKNCDLANQGRWMPVLWLLVAAIVLPGADWIVAQDADQGSKGKAALPAPWKPVEHQSFDTAANVEIHAEEVTVRSYDSKKAIAKIAADDDCDRDQASTILNVWLEAVLNNGGHVIVEGDRAIVRAGASGHKNVQTEIDRIVHYGFDDPIVLETRFCTISKALFGELPLSWRLADHQPARQPVVTTQLDSAKFDAIIDRVQADSKSHIMLAPKVTTYNGRSVNISDIVQRPFVVGRDPSQLTGAAVIRIEDDGIKLVVEPTYRNGVCDLRIDMTVSDISDVQVFSFPASSGQNVSVQVPQVNVQRFQTLASVKGGNSFAFAMPGMDDADQVFICILTPTSIETPKAEAPGLRNSSGIPLPAVAPPKAVQAMPRQFAYADLTSARTAPLATAAATIPDQRTTWLMKAEGSATDPEIVRCSEEILQAFDAKPKMQGDWNMKSSEGKLTLQGKNLLIRAVDDEFSIQSQSGSIEFDANQGAIRCVSHDDAEWEVDLRDLNLHIRANGFAVTEDGISASGERVFCRFAYAKDGYREQVDATAKSFRLSGDDLLLEGVAHLQLGSTECFAETIQIRDVAESPVLQLQGRVRVISDGDGVSEYRLNSILGR